MPQLKKILLIDDSEAINFIHKYIIEELNCCKEIISCQDGLQAITFLEKSKQEDTDFPEIIFIDLNMPIMNAWEFISAYKNFEPQLTNKTHIYLMTSSIDPGDKQNALALKEINAIKDKPFDEVTFLEILQVYKQSFPV